MPVQTRDPEGEQLPRCGGHQDQQHPSKSVLLLSASVPREMALVLSDPETDLVFGPRQQPL